MLNSQEIQLQNKFSQKSFLHLSSLSSGDILKLFEEAKKLKIETLSFKFQKKHSGSASLLFFENSSRTRMSFEMAAQHLGLTTVLLDSQSGSSLSKGESLEDTILNVAAMDPRVIIVRCGDDLNLEEMSSKISIPIVNAGWGKKGHPTQALLDLFTIYQEKPLKGFKLLIVGDVLHSRVAFSHFQGAHQLGVEIAGCGPSYFKPDETEIAKATTQKIKWFDHLDEALQWCDGVMVLRVQNERHSQKHQFDLVDYRKKFGIDLRKLKLLKSDGILMHPGPVNWGVELDNNILSDSRVRILKQVNNGLYIRMALLNLILKEE